MKGTQTEFLLGKILTYQIVLISMSAKRSVVLGLLLSAYLKSSDKQVSIIFFF